MTPLPDRPMIVINLDDKGNVKDIATNISPDVELYVVRSDELFRWDSEGMPFKAKRKRMRWLF